MTRKIAALAVLMALGTVAFSSPTAAQTVGVTVGAGQTVTNSANVVANVGIEFTGDGGTLINTGTVEASNQNNPSAPARIAAGPSAFVVNGSGNIPFNNIAITNSGTLQQDNGFCCSGMFFAGNTTASGAVTSVTGTTIVNQAAGKIVSLETGFGHDDRAISFEDGVNGAVVVNSGTISASGASTVSGGIHISSGAANTNGISISNAPGGVIQNLGGGNAISVIQQSKAGTVSNVIINNQGTITGGGIISAQQVAANPKDFAVPGPVTLGAITIGIDESGTSSLNTLATITGVQMSNTGTITGLGGVAIDNSTNTAPILFANAGTINGNILLGTGSDQFALSGGAVPGKGGIVQGNIIGQKGGSTLTFTPFSGNTAVVNGAITNVSNINVVNGTTMLSQSPTGFANLNLTGGTLVVANGLTVSNASLSGTGTIQGNVTVNQGSTVTVGHSPDPLTVLGNFSETGGALKFEIDANGKGFLTSTLVLGSTSDKVSLVGTQILLDFVGGADPHKFAQAGSLDLGTFFRVADGSLTDPLPLSDFLLSNDTFIAESGAIDMPLVLNQDGSLALPEPSTPPCRRSVAGVGACPGTPLDMLAANPFAVVPL
jgi:fibronectin-binding autotransporter adhesin